ncbi:hypothetical protein [Microbacterium thalli]|uniref:hypothetical protein n=1 Tax=Microbacterium thalli TaxID=3027921 RepID=UPI002366D732|nr:hypothetical protein [Microbacterium thalli]MDD7930086.1 hypothetical protein [Microbacterium thalli]
MSTKTNTETHYGVARGEKLLFNAPILSVAQDQLPLYEEQMTALGIDPDVRLVEYDVETTVKTSRLRAYKEPEVEPTPAPAPDATAAA